MIRFACHFNYVEGRSLLRAKNVIGAS